MRHPKRLLQEYLDDQATPSRAAAVQAHLARCAACRAEAARERRLRSRLRTAEVPVARPELREHTDLAARRAAGGDAGGYAAEPDPAAHRRRHRLISAAGAVAAAVGLVLSTAYLLGSWNNGESLNNAAPGLAAGWTEVTDGAGGTLSADQITDLRARGWACPELRSTGMSLVAAKAARIDGQPAVVMTLQGQGSTVTIYETRPAGSSSNAPVVDGVTGRAVKDEGFVLQEQEPGRPQVWLHPQRPQQAVLAAEGVAYTVDAAPPGEVLDNAVREISLTESSRLVLHPPESAQGVWDRIQRGLAIMAGNGNNR
ncbi:zf-HC2 domain-containing protein [Arthrobacter jiangjiafuii]|uniref:Zf-HC2 domain-containing protein n=1 Tax=Arthrobacter jiangjiafuii TaxID=2817475 RepID=A0A975QZ21_9MICC|nr:zf-HC2 domain-containing protein [Arthrobacter jiangjiafuii]MBP3044528.1 zf-HC2 domain-containing protein [Arthrobacter jiangjiafuii]QWC09365.1 zf-HC2 domain-containing protein [Arthrobacter jiangjiafuii]